MPSFGSSPPCGRRAAPRAEAPLTVELWIDGIKHSGILAEISRTGARLCGMSSLEEGQELTFKAGKVQAQGDVVWSQGDQCAVSFDTPIAAGEVGRLRALASFVASVRSH